MDITKRLSVLLITAITAVSLVSCGKDTSSEVSSASEVSSVINVKLRHGIILMIRKKISTKV
ncbi:hypothetical protein [uncultured Ruminococcus sp.]|uniref:hypothetical protein n=1 Tax=uncultured Ruminococcus sp. TaxID=165186 RepID=UPI00266F31BE|nr:hypothetical protein [uncultured Ruminococcus sp.]